MIRIQTEKLGNTASQMQSQRAQILLLRERTASLTAKARMQPYTEETMVRLNTLLRQLDEIEAAYTGMGDALTDVCRIAEETEAKVTEIYDSEQLKAGDFIVGRTRVFLNPNLERIARIAFQVQGTGG